MVSGGVGGCRSGWLELRVGGIVGEWRREWVDRVGGSEYVQIKVDYQNENNHLFSTTIDQ